MRLLSQDLSIVSVNLRKRLGDSTCRSNFEAWLADHRPEVLLAQEPVGQAKRLAGPTMYTLKGYQLLERTALVASWCRDDLQAAEIKTHTNRWQEITVHSLSIHNVYLPSESGRERIEMLGEMASYLRGSTFETLIAGDFNLAPKPEDRRFDGQPTIKLKSDRDREAKALDSLLSATSLYDATCDLQEFSWVQLRDKNSRKFSEWRCDLALLSNSLRAGAKVKYDHYLRTYSSNLSENDRGFTDHSAIIIKLSGNGHGQEVSAEEARCGPRPVYAPAALDPFLKTAPTSPWLRVIA